MKEDFLHFLWEYGLFERSKLATIDGEPIEIFAPGQHNTDAGPDFFNAKIKIGDTLWAGNVEIHVRASDWQRHAHNEDKAYDNVILHVVKENDSPVRHAGGQQPATLVMRYNPQMEARYAAMQQSVEWVACGKEASQVDLFHIKQFLSRLLVERLERKAQQLYDVLDATHNDWREAFYRLLFRAFGFGVNALPFEWLAKATPLSVIGRHRHALVQTEALLFGQAGMLSGEAKDDYQRTLQKEYVFLQTKFSLQPLEAHLWKFLRLRPSNFPTVRVAQLAMLLHRHADLMDKILASCTADDLYALFDVQASAYWDEHFTFGKVSRKMPKTIGPASIQRMIPNVIVPYLFVCGKRQGDETLCEKAVHLLETLPPEKNHIITGWEQTGVKPCNAFYTQALIQLKTNYCNAGQCLKCGIGINLLQKQRHNQS
ncbi:MAG: DUF2851 family protein [Prevotellaceae bacterium]|jgi:hypothetical protein|nr:DUF2851 family protein [Prevotellaceae bacterium]